MVNIYKESSLYFVDMFKNVFDYFKSNQSDIEAKYSFLGQNEAIISLEDKGYIFVMYIILLQRLLD